METGMEKFGKEVKSKFGSSEEVLKMLDDDLAMLKETGAGKLTILYHSIVLAYAHSADMDFQDRIYVEMLKESCNELSLLCDGLLEHIED